jgi:hypothetical protein
MFGQSRRNVVHDMAARMQVPRGCVPVAVASGRPDHRDQLDMKTPLHRPWPISPLIGQLTSTACFRKLLMSVGSSVKMD